MPTAKDARHGIVFRDPYSYFAHPEAIRLRDGAIVMVFNRAPRREVIMHPPQDPMFMNMVTRSTDEGETWSAPEVAPGYGWTGTECAGLTELPDGRVMLNNWKGTWLPLSQARSMPPEPLMTWPAELLSPWIAAGVYSGHEVERNPEAHAPWVRNGGRCFVHFSSDGARSFNETVEIDTAPLIGGYGNRGGVVTAAGRILLPLTDAYRFTTLFLVTSDDMGASWSAPQVIADAEGSEFEEPATLSTRSGRILMIIRDNGLRTMHAIHSDDAGETWSERRDLQTAGHPAHLAELPDGRILMTYGWRIPDHGIRAVWSSDNGRTWSDPVILRAGMGNANLGYPCTIHCNDGSLLSLYYGEDESSTTCIQSTRWSLPD